MALVAASADPEDFNSGKLYRLFTMSTVPGERPREVNLPEVKRERPLASDPATMVCNRTWYGNSGKFNI
jgi:hypothetical protein